MSSQARTRQFLQLLSILFGWIYTLSWSASFYPQPLLNWKRRSTRGTSIDFPFLNVIGFFCYTTTTGTFLYNQTVRLQYAARHPVSPEPTARFNDFIFGLHAVILVILTYSQSYPSLWRFDVPKSQRVSRPIAIVVAGCAIMLAVSTIVMLATNGISHQDVSKWAWIDVVYTLGNIKLIGTFFKYLPQVVMNYRRKSTVGWSIWTILLDFFGGILSLGQLVIDAGLQNDWSGITGNPVKLGLSNISICFDIIFIVQHYVLYRHASVDPDDGENKPDEHTPLLNDG